MTSELRDEVSVPWWACCSNRSVDGGVLLVERCWSWRAIARPTAPPPMMACVKSA